jgi:hypothetical protein
MAGGPDLPKTVLLNEFAPETQRREEAGVCHALSALAHR